MIESREGAPVTLQLTVAGHATLERLSATGEQRLADLLADWRPREDPQLAALISTLARAFFIDTSALDGQLPAAELAASGT